jgi:hypothetical protein
VTFSLSDFSKQLKPEVADAFSTLYFSNIKEAQTTEKEIEETISRFRQLSVQHRMKDLTVQLQQLEAKAELNPDEEKQMNEILKEVVSLRGK